MGFLCFRKFYARPRTQRIHPTSVPQLAINIHLLSAILYETPMNGVLTLTLQHTIRFHIRHHLS